MGVFVGKFHTRWRRSVLFAHGLMRIFPAISARKGADDRKVGFSQKHRDAAEVHAELSGTARSGTGYPWLSLRACSNRWEFFEPADSASPLDSAAAIRAEPQFQEHRRTRTVAESPRLSLPQVCLRRIAEPHSYGRGRLRRETAGSRYRKTGYGLFFATVFQITDRPRKMRQYRFNRESILYIERIRTANTPRGHRKSCRDEFETLPIPPLRRRRPRRKKMKPQSSFQGACRYFLQGILCRYFAEAFSLSIRRGYRRFASCRVRKQSNFGTQPIFGAFRELPPNPRFKSCDCAEYATPDFRKNS